MQPLAEASVANSVPIPSSQTSGWCPESRAASKSGATEPLTPSPRYSHGISPTQMYQVSVAAISSVMIPASVPKGSARPASAPLPLPASCPRSRDRTRGRNAPRRAPRSSHRAAPPALGHQLGMVHLAGADDARSREEQDQDRREGDGGNDEVEGQRRQHPAIVEPGEEQDDEHDEGPLVEFPGKAAQPRHLGHQIAGDRIRRLQHRIGEGQVEADVEGHQRPDDVLGLGILAPRRAATVEVTSLSIIATQV